MAGESARDLARRQREKAERLLRAAERNDKGAAGEEATARALDALPPDEWSVFHDVRWPDRKLANVDHIVVGPPGVFVIDSKNWSGTVTITDDVLRQNGYRREHEVASAAEAAVAITRLVPDVPPSAVFAVLCFTTDRPITGFARDVAVCTTANVVEMLTTRPTVLTRESRLWTTTRLDVRLAKAAERDRSEWGRDAPPYPARAASSPALEAGSTGATPIRERSPRRRRARARRRSSAAIVRFLTAVIVAAGFLLTVTRTDLVERFSDYVVHVGTSTQQDSPTKPDVMRHGAKTRDAGAKKQTKKHANKAAHSERGTAGGQH